jgi:hypothetical protein
VSKIDTTFTPKILTGPACHKDINHTPKLSKTETKSKTRKQQKKQPNRHCTRKEK